MFGHFANNPAVSLILYSPPSRCRSIESGLSGGLAIRASTFSSFRVNRQRGNSCCLCRLHIMLRLFVDVGPTNLCKVGVELTLPGARGSYNIHGRYHHDGPYMMTSESPPLPDRVPPPFLPVRWRTETKAKQNPARL